MLKQLPGCRNHGSDVGPPFEMLQEFLRGWGRALFEESKKAMEMAINFGWSAVGAHFYHTELISANLGQDHCLMTLE